MIRFAPLFLLSACAAPEGAFRSEVGLEGLDAADTNARFATFYGTAEETLRVALPAIQDTTLSDALIEAAGRGVEVLVVTDVDQAADPGVVALQEAGIPVTLADGPYTNFDFSLNVDVAWPSTDVMMTHAFAVADRTRWIGATSAGTVDLGTRVVLEGMDEDLGTDLGLEHVQVFGGADATDVDAYGGMNKSIADPRWRYGTQSDAELQMWFAPQERPTKRVTDAVYAARRSIRILTDDLANDGLARALADKERDGFEVTVIVGPHFGTASSLLSRELTDAGVQVLQITDAERVPTVVITDLEGGSDTVRRGMILTHDIYSSSRLYRATEVRTDQLLDGACWELVDTGGTSSLLDPLQSVWDDHLARAEAL